MGGRVEGGRDPGAAAAATLLFKSLSKADLRLIPHVSARGAARRRRRCLGRWEAALGGAGRGPGDTRAGRGAGAAPSVRAGAHELLRERPARLRRGRGLRARCRRACGTTRGTPCTWRCWPARRAPSAATSARRRRRPTAGTRSGSPSTKTCSSTSRASRAPAPPACTCWRVATASECPRPRDAPRAAPRMPRWTSRYRPGAGGRRGGTAGLGPPPRTPGGAAPGPAPPGAPVAPGPRAGVAGLAVRVSSLMALCCSLTLVFPPQ